MAVEVFSNPIRICYVLAAILTMHYTYGQDLKRHQWNNRVVLLLSDQEDIKTYQQQIAQFNGLPKDLLDRKIIIYQVLPKRYRIMNNLKNTKSNNWIASTILFDKFANKGRDFKIILIGLDGSPKLEQANVLTATELFGTIDAMPMRRAELNRKKNR